MLSSSAPLAISTIGSDEIERTLTLFGGRSFSGCCPPPWASPLRSPICQPAALGPRRQMSRLRLALRHQVREIARRMIRIAISQAAFDAIAKTLFRSGLSAMRNARHENRGSATMRLVVVFVAAYLLSGIYYVCRDLSEKNVMRQGGLYWALPPRPPLSSPRLGWSFLVAGNRDLTLCRPLVSPWLECFVLVPGRAGRHLARDTVNRSLEPLVAKSHADN